MRNGKKTDHFTSIFDLIKRVNQRTVNKKTLESLAYAGAFDCFKELHRAQYFFIAPGISLTAGKNHPVWKRVSGAMHLATPTPCLAICHADGCTPPKIPNCEPWSLTELLDHEKEVTGMFMSGHPLDHFSFEIKHYGITRLSEFNEIKEAVTLQANPGKTYKLAGLVVDAQHRVTKTGRKFGSFFIEDYTGKSEFMLWSDDYVKYSSFLEKGKNLYITGCFRQRFNKPEFEFKIDRITFWKTLSNRLQNSLL